MRGPQITKGVINYKRGNHMDETRLNDLLNLYFDGALAGAEKAELEEQLVTSRRARKRFWKQASLHAFTREAAQLKWSEHAQAAEETVASPVYSDSRIWREIAARFSAWRWTWARGLAVSGAMALLMAGLFMAIHANRQVAMLARAVDAEWLDTKPPPAVGAGLKRGWFRLNRGAVELDFGKGAQVVFEAPAEICLVSENEAVCRLGRFRAQVPQQAHGFKLSFQGAEVVDLGTEFGV